MTTMNISLPKPLKEFVHKEVKQGNYGTASEYLRKLVRDAQERRVEDEIDRLLLEGIESGRPVRVTKAWWDRKRAKMRKLLARKKRA